MKKIRNIRLEGPMNTAELEPGDLFMIDKYGHADSFKAEIEANPGVEDTIIRLSTIQFDGIRLNGDPATQDDKGGTIPSSKTHIDGAYRLRYDIVDEPVVEASSSAV